jgi:hypothetical protein
VTSEVSPVPALEVPDDKALSEELTPDVPHSEDTVNETTITEATPDNIDHNVALVSTEGENNPASDMPPKEAPKEVSLIT